MHCPSDNPDGALVKQRTAEPAALRWRTAALLVALAAIWFADIGARVLTEPDEGRYAEVPREMLASGDWLVPRLNGIQYLEKPPLQYWATAVLYSVLGVKPWVSRLWTTGLGLACILLVWRTGRRLYGAAAGTAAALVLASSPLFFILGQINTLDMGLTFFLTAALVAFVSAQRAPVAAPAQRSAMTLAWLALGLATLQKGLVALALPGFALVLYTLLERDLALWRRMHLTAGIAIVLAVNLPWWILMAHRNPQFVQFFFVHEHLTRFATTEHGRSQPWWYFTAILSVGALPWFAPIARGVTDAWRAPPLPAGSRFRTERFLLNWAAAVFLFYSPSGSKLAPYILPMMPPLALLAGRYLASTNSRALRSTLLLAAGFAIVLLLAEALAPRLAHATERDAFAALGSWAMKGGLVLACATAAAAWLARLNREAASIATLALGLAAGLALLTVGTNVFERTRGGPLLARHIAPHLEAASAFYCVGTYFQTVTFSLRRTCMAVGSPGELEVRFDDGERNFIATYAEFATEWARSRRPVAVVAPAVWPDLQALQIPATIVASEPAALVIIKPDAHQPLTR
jgi:4-amino-4-deoxy-L-arabinose transferase-like glycosyltransferase